MIAKDILKLIETVSPDDTAMLDEIDARVNWLLCQTNLGEGFTVPCDEKWFEARRRNGCPEYTRSRDALKAIRPEGWFQGIELLHGHEDSNRGKVYYSCDGGYALPTEELAELHAIIQAIEHERASK